MPKIHGADELTKFIPIPAGVHILTLTKVEERETPNPFADKDEDGTYLETGTAEPPIRPQLLWIFESEDRRPDGEAYAYGYWTGRYYGDDRAKLTAFLNAILPDSTEEQRKSIDTDSLVGARFRVRIATKKNQKGQDRPYHTLIEPAPAPSAPTSETPVPTSPALRAIAPRAMASPVNPEMKQAIGVALNEASKKEGQGPLKTRLLAELGRLRYASYADFLARGDADAAAILKFINPEAFFDPDEIPL